MAASSSTAAHSDNNQWYDVFLNHRGVDVKKTFARSLYLRLLDNGLKAFLGQEELQPGYNFPSQIIDAIGTASVHVAIFSPHYAESAWCLNELLLMLKSEAPIIPVFYRVTPAEVRRRRGRYAEALQNLAEKKTREEKVRYDSDTIENWRKALSLVADKSGFELEACSGAELEQELLSKLVKYLSEKAKRDKPNLYVAEYPTGLKYKLKDFEDTVLLQQQQRGKPQILGIVGLGGVGKTTLAKEFFNREKSNYLRSCFLQNVKDKAAEGSLNLLQRQLLKTLIRSNKPVDSVDEGQERLREPLKSVNALLILDDVDDVDQVKILLPVRIDDLCPGSLILITSRDKGVLISSRVKKQSIYKLTELNTQHSRELFCSHAFLSSLICPIFLLPYPCFALLKNKQYLRISVAPVY